MGHLQVRYTVRYFKDYFQYNGSVARMQFDVEMLKVVHRYFDFLTGLRASLLELPELQLAALTLGLVMQKREMTNRQVYIIQGAISRKILMTKLFALNSFTKNFSRVRGVPGEEINILGGQSIGLSKQKVHMPYSKRFPRKSYYAVQSKKS
jgi:hypothetical protein